MNVVRLNCTKAWATRKIREVAKDSRNLQIQDPPGDGPWERTVSVLEAKRCVEDGDIIEDPVQDELGNWKFLIRRFSSGGMLTVQAVLYENEQGEWKVYAKAVSKE